MKPNNIRRIREDRDLTQVDLAQLTGVSQRHISQIEIGLATNPSWEVLSSIAYALGVTPQELIPPVRKRTPAPPRRRRTKREAA